MEASMHIEGLLDIEQISPRLIHSKKDPFIYCTDRVSHQKELEEEGWVLIPTKSQYSIKMKKAKSHDDAFEDRVWALFANMKFDYLNDGNQFKLGYAPGLTKQLDVIAADDEAILIVECKSCETLKKASYQKDINELISLKPGLRQAAQKMLPGKPRVAFIFATNKAVLSEPDKARLAEGGVFQFGEADLEYWEQLVNHLGAAAKYQLFGKLFAGQEIPNLTNRIPAIKGKMASGHTFYAFAIDPNFLLRMGFILHRTEANTESSEAYQRLISKTRLQEIGRFINEGGYFPNSIIINIEIKDSKPLKFELSNEIENDSETIMGVLHLPKLYRSAFIIDGQHRLYGYSKAESSSHHTIPVVAFVNLPQKEQAKIFVDINHHQKSVPKNLLRSIMADFNWGAEDASLALSALKTRLVSRLNFDNASPFYQRIILAEEKRTSIRCLTLETILSWGLSSKSGYFGKTKGKNIIKTGYLSDVNLDETLKKSIDFFEVTFDYIQANLKEQWDLGSEDGGFIAMNIGVTATMKTIDQILDYIVKSKGVNPEDLTGQELAEKVIPYLKPVVDYIHGLDTPGLKKLRAYFGASAPDKVMMEFINAVHEKYSDFETAGLNQWIKEHSGKYNSLAWDLGNQNIEPLIHDSIINMLKKEYGEKCWWSEGVPKLIQKSCSDARIDAGSTEPDWHFLNTIHYREIIEKNWSILGVYFTPPGTDSMNRDKKLQWLVKLNLVRQRYSHPQRDIITEVEYNFLEELYGWLKEKLANQGR
jgi:DNA sulfur modification protein DndB